MKQLLLTILFLFTGWTISVAQHSKTKIPKKVLNDIPKLTAYLTKDCQYERQKVDSIHSWITHNIKYDVKYLEKNDCGRFEGSAEVLKSKKTLCMGYVYLMGAMLDELKIEWELISGYTNVSKPYYVPKYLVDNHAWIAIKVEGEWMTADPTWDAGYVGALPKKDRRPSIEKQQKKIDKIIKKNEKLLAAGDELKEVPALDTAKDNVEYSSKIGFVQTGTREWFLVPADSFLTRHLPANPLWQLRLPNLPLEVFSEGSDSIHDFFAANPDQGYVIGVVDHFQQQLLLDKVLANGVMGNQFNSSNTRTKVVHYHHFLEILNIPEVKKNFKGLPELYNRALTQKMIEVSDTTIKLTKSAQAFEKNRHKEVTTACAKGFKNANSANKKFQTSAEKVKKWNEKMLANLEKSDLKLKTDLERLQTADESKSKPEVTPDFEAIAEVHQLVKQLTDSLDRMDTAWHRAMNDSTLWKIAGETSYSNYMLKQRGEILQQKSLHLYQYTEKADNYLINSIGTIDTLYNDSLKREIYPAAFNKVVFQLSKIDRTLDMGLNDAVKQGRIKEAAPYRAYYTAIAEYYSGVARKNTIRALNHNSFMRSALEQFDENWDDIAVYNEEQVKLAKEKNDFVLEEEEHAHNREEDMLKTMAAESTRWKAKLKGK